MEDGGDSGWIEQTDDGHLKRERERCLSDSSRSESSSPGRAISYCWHEKPKNRKPMQGRKTLKGSKGRIDVPRRLRYCPWPVDPSTRLSTFPLRLPLRTAALLPF